MQARLLAMLAAMTGSCFVSSIAAAQDLVRVAIPQRGSWETSPPDIGQAKGIFAKHGLKIESLYTSGGGETMQALIAGSVDVALATGTTAVLAAYVKGAPIRPIAASITNAPDIFWYVPAESPLTSLKQADSKTIAFSAVGSSSHLATLKLIQLSGAKLTAVATGSPPGTYTQTMSGQIDIGWSAVPFGIEQLEQKRIRVVARYVDIPEYRDMTARLHVANMAFLQKPDVVKRFLAAYSETLQWMYAGDEALAAFAKFYDASLKEVTVTREEFYRDKAVLDLTRLGGIDQAMEDAVALKFIQKPLTKTQLEDLFSYFDGANAQLSKR